ncbi:hypothetical protein B0F90DRAFT_1668438 [Multifurca ochricompacta]|uniref:Uncharacterized protein n=1 Tax=Multifurca ochricompacta TaxID=376703 RepID=A0AAD4M5D0_9AGAM|nr:hypothetical protein B0F90DRAFT_1668438 [Multifurca ochricompacta]
MFGESESESPRVPSPWDLILSPSPANKVYHRQGKILLPELAPEVEEGNVEYKLHLVNPSPARFARLVTQMKWRLLEGGGQAIYELGVADSGSLVGLEPENLRATLVTLHAMANEIGARVIITKEIEITVADMSGAGFHAPPDKRHGSRDNKQRSAIKNHSKVNPFPVEDSPCSFVSATSTSVDSSGSMITDSWTESSSQFLPSPPTYSIGSPVRDREAPHESDSLLVFPMLTEDDPRCLAPAESLTNGSDSLIGYTLANTVSGRSTTEVEGGRDTFELHNTQHTMDVGPEVVALAITAVDALADRNELFLAALAKLEITNSALAPGRRKRKIVEP